MSPLYDVISGLDIIMCPFPIFVRVTVNCGYYVVFFFFVFLGKNEWMDGWMDRGGERMGVEKIKNNSQS